jgi:tetratricopeptide (TPR) repeat protein
MKLLISIGIFLLLQCQLALGATNYETLFNKANQLFIKGDYRSADLLYTKLETTDTISAALYCNWGNSNYQEGQMGQAIYHYRKGLQLSPFDKQLQHNLKLAYNKAGVTNQTEELQNQFHDFSLANMSICIGSVLLLIATICYLLTIPKYLKRIHRAYKITAKTLFITGAAILVVAILTIKLQHSARTAIIIHQSAAGYIGPSQKAKRLVILRSGELVNIRNLYNGWYKVQRADGKHYWMQGQDLIVED